MNPAVRRALPVFLVLSCLALASCPNPMGADVEKDASKNGSAAGGTVSVRLKLVQSERFPAASSATGGAARTVWPDVDGYEGGDATFFIPASYHVQANGPNQRRMDRTISSLAIDSPLDGFLPGSWLFTVEAINDRSWTIAGGTAYVTIGSGASSTVSVALLSTVDPSSSGAISVGVYWPATIVTPALSGTITALKPEHPSAPLDFSGCYSPGSCVKDIDYPAGMYRLDLRLDASVPDPGTGLPAIRTVWGVSEILYVFQGLTSRYHAALTENQLMQGPPRPYINLDSGVIVDSGGVGTPVTINCDPNAVTVYTVDGSLPDYDGQTRTVLHGAVYAPGDIITLGNAQADSDGAITVQAQSFNDWGHSLPDSKTYYPSDAIYADSNSAASLNRGTRTDPYNGPASLAAASVRAMNLNRDANTDMRAAVGLYPGEISLSGGTTLSGSYDPASWTRSGLTPADPALYTQTNATLIEGGTFNGTYDSSATISILGARDLPVRVEYLCLLGPTAGAGYSGNHLSALAARSMGGSTFELDHLSLRGNGNSGNTSYGLSAENSLDIRMSYCFISGRETGSFSGVDTYGVSLLYSYLTDIGSIISAGSAEAGTRAYGLRAYGYDSGAYLSGSALSGSDGTAGNAAESYGISAQAGSGVHLDGCDVEAGFGLYACGLSASDSSAYASGSRIAAVHGGASGAFGVSFLDSYANAANSLTLSGNGWIEAGSGGGASCGVYVSAIALSAPVLIERNRIRGGNVPGGANLRGLAVEQSGASAADVVIRNNLILRGTGSSLGSAVSLSDADASASANVILANNDLLSDSVSIAAPALVLAGHADPWAINNLFVATGPSNACVVHEGGALPQAMLNNAFIAAGSSYYADGSTMTPANPNGFPFGYGAGQGNFLGNATAPVFSAGIAAAMSNFAVFDGSLDPLSDIALRQGALDLSSAFAAPASLGAWLFGDDFPGADRTAGNGWSMGAAEY